MKARVWIGVAVVAAAGLGPAAGWGAARSFSEDMSAAEFRAWQAESRAFLAEVLYNGPAPERVELEAQRGGCESRDGYELCEVSFHDRPDHVSRGRLAVPDDIGRQRRPAIVSLHGHGPPADKTFDPAGMYYYGDRFARQGYVVFEVFIDHKDIGYKNPFGGLGPLPRHVRFPSMGRRTWMVTRAIDYISSLPQVDPERIGVVGLSNGGLTAMFVGAIDERVKLTIAAGSFISHERMWHSNLLHCRCQYLYRLDGELDYSDVYALIAPRALIVQNGRRDPIFPIDDSLAAFPHLLRAYEILGVPDLVVHDLHPGPHAFAADVPLAWAERILPLPGPESEKRRQTRDSRILHSGGQTFLSVPLRRRDMGSDRQECLSPSPFHVDDASSNL